LDVEIKFIDVDFRSYPCPRCGTDSPRHDGAVRHAIDVGLDHPVVLQIKVGCYRCPRCRKRPNFRTPLDFLAPYHRFVRRCRQKVSESVEIDRMPISLAARRLERDFHVPIAGSTAWTWYRESGPDIANVADYQHLVVASFSGVLSVDEVYDGKYAILCARDPLNNRTIAYELGETMNKEVVTTFFQHLHTLGIEPEVVVSDGSNLYPKAIKAVWAAAKHQLCRFHWTKDIVSAVMSGVRDYRKSLPKPKRRERRGRPAAGEAPAQQQAAAGQLARDEVRKGRFLLVMRRENMNDAQKTRLKELEARHPALAVVRRFMDGFYGIFDGKPRPSTAEERRLLLLADPAFAESPILAGARKILQDADKFSKVALYLNFKNLGSTSNDVERDNRGFRKRQKAHYRLRTESSLQALTWSRLVETGPPSTENRLQRRFGNPTWIKGKAA
jgi:hypothetical protein